jgi:hypothetical protein
MLRMDKSISKEDKMKRVEKLLKDVNLIINLFIFKISLSIKYNSLI